MLRFSLCQISARAHAKTKPRVLGTPYAVELAKWRKETKEAITQHRKDFWVSQTEVEHKWMDDYMTNLNEKLHRRSIRSKERTILLCKRTQEKLDFLAQKKKRQDAKAEARRAREAAEKASREHLIAALNIDSSTWYTPSNFQTKLVEEVIVPYALDHTDYYQDLVLNAGHAKEGRTVDNSMLYNNRNETVVRNSLLLPLFTDVKSAIRRLTYTEATKLDHDFEAAKAVLRSEQRENADALIKSLREKYVKLSAAVNHAELSPKGFIEKAYNQAILIEQLLMKWNQYISIARLDDKAIMVYSNSMDFKDLDKGRGEPAGLMTQKAEETWENDFVDANPEDSDAAPGEGSAAISELANEKDEMLNALSSFDVEKVIPPAISPQTASPPAEPVQFDMYSGQGVHIPSSLRETAQGKMDAMMNFMFGNLAKELGEPETLFETVNVVEDPKFILQPVKTKEFNPSFVLDRLRKTLLGLKDDELPLEVRVKKSELLTALNAIENIRVTEPRLLLKVFSHHRYEPPRFRVD